MKLFHYFDMHKAMKRYKLCGACCVCAMRVCVCRMTMYIVCMCAICGRRETATSSTKYTNEQEVWQIANNVRHSTHSLQNVYKVQSWI